ncbi:MAG: hypothetical protein RSC29_03825, partial [Oscillospiraceae bacterium]
MNGILVSSRFIIILLLCCLCYFPMNNFRFSKKCTNLIFWTFTAIVVLFNILIMSKTGNESLNGIMLISIALPYFILILSLTQGPVAQRIFNFWLWINIYLAISTINSVYKYFVPGHYFLDIFVVII